MSAEPVSITPKPDLDQFFDNPPIFDVAPMNFKGELTSGAAWGRLAHDILSPFNEYTFYIKQSQKIQQNQAKFTSLLARKPAPQVEKLPINTRKIRKFKSRPSIRTHHSFFPSRTFKDRSNHPTAPAHRRAFSPQVSSKTIRSKDMLSPLHAMVPNHRRESFISMVGQIQPSETKSVKSIKLRPPERPKRKKPKADRKSFAEEIHSMLRKELRGNSSGESTPARKHCRTTGGLTPFSEAISEETPKSMQIPTNYFNRSRNTATSSTTSPSQLSRPISRNAMSPDRTTPSFFHRTNQKSQNTPQKQYVKLNLRNINSAKKPKTVARNMQEELKHRYSPLTTTKFDIQMTYENLSPLQKPKVSKYALRHFIKIKNLFNSPEKPRKRSPRKTAERQLKGIRKVIQESAGAIHTCPDESQRQVVPKFGKEAKEILIREIGKCLVRTPSS